MSGSAIIARHYAMVSVTDRKQIPISVNRPGNQTILTITYNVMVSMRKYNPEDHG